MDNVTARYEEEQKKIRAEVEQKSGKTAEELYEERDRRADDAISLRVPDRIPLTINIDPANHTSIQRAAAYYDPVAWNSAVREVTVAFEPDLCNAGLPTSGAALAALKVTNRLWPGGPLPPNYEYQFEEGEFLKADEIDMYLTDPTDCMIRRILPRIYESLEPFTKLPPLGLMMQGFEGITPVFATKEFAQLAAALAEAGRETEKFREAIGNSYNDLAFLGFPPFSQMGVGGVGGAPFDTVSSFLRGMKGSMLDMYRQPDRLINLCNFIIDKRIALSVRPEPLPTGRPRRVHMPLWRGDKSFMSQKQFETFYWPGLKRALQATIDLGCVPIPIFEAEFGDRLESLLELPKGKIIASVEYVDLAKAREILKGHTCVLIRGPFSLKKASPREVVDCYKDIFDRYGAGGGMIMNIRLPDDCDVETIQSMLSEIREYVRY